MAFLLFKKAKDYITTFKNREVVITKDYGLAVHDGYTTGGNIILPNLIAQNQFIINNNFIVNTANGHSWQNIDKKTELSNRWVLNIYNNVVNVAVSNDTNNKGLLINSHTSNNEVSFTILTQQFFINKEDTNLDITFCTIAKTRDNSTKRIFIELSFFDDNDDAISLISLGTIDISSFKALYTISKKIAIPDNTKYASLRIWIASGSNYNERTGGISNKANLHFYNIGLNTGKQAKIKDATYIDTIKLLEKYEKNIDIVEYFKSIPKKDGNFGNLVSLSIPINMLAKPDIINYSVNNINNVTVSATKDYIKLNGTAINGNEAPIITNLFVKKRFTGV